jgi:hypothetical protein
MTTEFRKLFNERWRRSSSGDSMSTSMRYLVKIPELTWRTPALYISFNAANTFALYLVVLSQGGHKKIMLLTFPGPRS